MIVAIASVRHLVLFRNKPKIVWRTFILSYIILAIIKKYILFPKNVELLSEKLKRIYRRYFPIDLCGGKPVFACLF